MYTLDNYYITVRGKIMKQKAKKSTMALPVCYSNCNYYICNTKL